MWQAFEAEGKGTVLFDRRESYKADIESPNDLLLQELDKMEFLVYGRRKRSGGERPHR